MSKFLEHHTDEELWSKIADDAKTVAKAMEKKEPGTFTVPAFFGAYLNEVNKRIEKDGLPAHPLFWGYAAEMAKLDDAAADNLYDVAQAIKDLPAPPRLEKEFGSVSGRPKGAPPPRNIFRDIAAAKANEKGVPVMPTVKIAKRQP
jgi:hypothetical protein